MTFWPKGKGVQAPISLGSGSESTTTSPSTTPLETSMSALATPVTAADAFGPYERGTQPRFSSFGSLIPNSSCALPNGSVARGKSGRSFLSAKYGDSGCFAARSYRHTATVHPQDEVMRILFLGPPQVGKSSLVNCYRAVLTNGTKWPAAFVGVCGYCGTTTVDPLPDNPKEPTVLCIDTPGKFYGSSEMMLLNRLIAGVPWKIKVAGKGSLTAQELEAAPIVPENKPHHAVLVVPATDLVEDNGWLSVIQMKWRYCPAQDAEGAMHALRELICTIRSLQNDASPFVVVTKMDKVGGVDNSAARSIICSCLSHCVPVNRVYFCACPDDESSYEERGVLHVDRHTRRSLLKLHEDLMLAYRWQSAMGQQEASPCY
uniref:Uncharacterized protein n=1 Tax=Trypanosoma congolense (strain IL3000) TaxID=1068625 RepID=G0UU64_TRYCI|nr:conserved hypothetical protein [Trypanosoma congolense IL3000]